jgi:hypothetical protein
MHESGARVPTCMDALRAALTSAFSCDLPASASWILLAMATWSIDTAPSGEPRGEAW